MLIPHSFPQHTHTSFRADPVNCNLKPHLVFQLSSHCPPFKVYNSTSSSKRDNELQQYKINTNMTLALLSSFWSEDENILSRFAVCIWQRLPPTFLSFFLSFFANWMLHLYVACALLMTPKFHIDIFTLFQPSCKIFSSQQINTDSLPAAILLNCSILRVWLTVIVLHSCTLLSLHL